MKNPNLIPRPFAQNGQKDDIPADYKSDLPSQKATWDTGFPQITMMPVTAGGLPPSGRDFNGILNQISDNIVHLSKGGKYKFSPEYANSIGGYPKGAILQSNDETNEFQSLIDNNKIDFNTASADKINSAWKLVNTNQILDLLNKKFDKLDVVQSIGTSTSQVMSQKSTTDALRHANDNANSRLEKSRNGADIPNKSEFVKNLGLITTGHGSDMIFFGPNGMKMQIFQRRVVNSPSINGAENTPITYPRAFPGGVWGVFCTKMDYVQVSASCELVTPTGFQCVTFNASTTTVVSNIVFLAVGW